MYQYGKFSGQNTDWVAWALILYTIGLVGHATLEVVVRAFYALHDTKTPVLVGATAMTINLILSILLVLLFNKIGWIALGGLALSTSYSSLRGNRDSFCIASQAIEGHSGQRTSHRYSSRNSGLAGHVSNPFHLDAFHGYTFAVLTTLGGVALGGAVYGLVLILLRVPEINSLFQWMQTASVETNSQP